MDIHDKLDAPLAVRYERTTDNRSVSPSRTSSFKLWLTDRFVFSERIGFKAYYDKRYL
jgi:hypothetical protein